MLLIWFFYNHYFRFMLRRVKEDVLDLLKSERKGEKRWSIIQRLHQRYTILRATRERDELHKEATK